MKIFRNVLRDKSANNLIVAVLIGFSTVTYIQFIANVVAVNHGPPADFWVRTTVAYVGTLLLAWMISWFAR